jgi:WD40 repeat protein
VLRTRSILKKQGHQIRRGGLMYLGALRELLIVALAVGTVMTTLWQASTLLDLHLSSQKGESATRESMPVLSLVVDQENQRLFAYSWVGTLREFSLKTGIVSSRIVPQNIVEVAMSANNFTTAMHAEWAEERRIHHRVDVIRNDQIVISEEVDFGMSTSACITISASGNIVMCFSAEGIGIGWNLTESEPHRWEINVGKNDHVNCLSPDGHRLFVSSADGHAFICDPITGEAKILINDIERSCRSVAWSADGKRLSIADQEGGVHVVDAVTGKRTWHVKLNFEFARSLALTNDGKKIAAGGFDHTIRVWDLTRPDQAPILLKGQLGVIRSLAFNASNETLISGSFNGSIFEWTLSDQTIARQFQ